MQPIPPDRLEKLVRGHVDGDAVTLSPIPTGKFNESYFVEVDGRRLVLRVAPPDDSVFVFYERGMMRQEPEIHRLLLETTEIPVAPIIAFDSSRDIVDRDAILMERLRGEPLSEIGRVDVDAALEEVGRCLAQAHAITGDRYGYTGEHAPMVPRPTWIDAFRDMWSRLLDDIRAVGYYTDAERDGLRQLFESHATLFDRDVPASLLHMDVWGQNILVDDVGKLTGLVDWDRSLRGDPEIEFAVLDYCGISTPSFWRGYGRERDASPEAGIRRVLYLLYELQKYIVIRAGRSGDPGGARRYKQQVQEIVQAAFGATP